MIRSGVGGTVYTYPVINIGALDDDYASSSSYKERKVNYSDMGSENSSSLAFVSTNSHVNRKT